MELLRKFGVACLMVVAFWASAQSLTACGPGFDNYNYPSNYPSNYPPNYPSNPYPNYPPPARDCRYGNCYPPPAYDYDYDRPRHHHHDHDDDDRDYHHNDNRPYNAPKPRPLPPPPPQPQVIRPSCPSGTTFDGQHCIINDKSKVKPGHKGTVNACPKGMWLSNGTCVPDR